MFPGPLRSYHMGAHLLWPPARLILCLLGALISPHHLESSLQQSCVTAHVLLLCLSSLCAFWRRVLMCAGLVWNVFHLFWTQSFCAIRTCGCGIRRQTHCPVWALAATWQVLQATSPWCLELGSAQRNTQQGHADGQKEQLPLSQVERLTLLMEESRTSKVVRQWKLKSFLWAATSKDTVNVLWFLTKDLVFNKA